MLQLLPIKREVESNSENNTPQSSTISTQDGFEENANVESGSGFWEKKEKKRKWKNERPNRKKWKIGFYIFSQC